MFRLLAVALLGGFLTIGLTWAPLGAGALVLAPLVASLGTLAYAALLCRREASAGSEMPGTGTGSRRTGAPGNMFGARRMDPAALCRRRS